MHAVEFRNAVSDFMLKYAEKIQPAHCCLVPEKREELTTEGGLNVLQDISRVRDACVRLHEKNIEVSLFIDPDLEQISAAVECKAPVIELHTGCYANAANEAEQQIELARIIKAAEFAHQAGLIVNAGHGLNYQNVQAIARIPQLHELNIGHGIIAEALFVGLENAVREMKRLMREVR